METKLTAQLLELGTLYASAMRLEDSTVGRLCAADGRFFARLRHGKTFSVRKFDDVVAWFSANWPADMPWPSDIERPADDHLPDHGNMVPAAAEAAP